MVLLNSGTETLVSASPWRWTSSVTLSERYDDNLLLVPENEASDFVTILAPQLRVSSSSGEVPRYIQYRAQVERYTRSGELNTVKHFAELEWTARITKAATLTLTDHFSFTPDSTEITSVGVAVPRGDAYGNDSAVGLRFSVLDLSYQYGLREFEAHQLSDSESHILEERVALPLTIRHVVTQSYRLRHFIEDGKATLRSHTVGAGLQYHFTTTFLIGAEGGIAYWRTSSDDSFRSGPMVGFNLDKSFKQLKLSFSYLKDFQSQWRGSVEYSLEKTVLRINYSKELTAGSGVLREAVNRQTASANLQQRISRRADLALTAGYTTNRPISGDQNRFKSYRGETSLSYVIRPWLKTSIQYNYFKQDSDGTAQPEFRRHQGMLSLTATMP